MSKLSRRTFLAFGLLSSQALLAACGGGGGEAEASQSRPLSDPAAPAPATPAPAAPAPTAPAPAAPPQWTVRESLTFLAGASTIVNLNDTLPNGVARGGTFSVSSTGAGLPPGAVLGSDGVLTITAGIGVGVTAGVVFAYTTP